MSQATFRLGLVVEPVLGHERFRGYLSIPYLSPAGVRAIKFRCLAHPDSKCDGHGKYDAPSGQKPRIYNAQAILQERGVVAVCEGEMDAIVCSDVVGIPAVGVPGVSTWMAHAPRMFAGIDSVLILADSDDKPDGRNPGKELADRIARDLHQAIIVAPPKGEDLTTWVLSAGPEAVRKACGL